MSSMFAFLGAQEVVVILAIALLVFGPAKLPEIGRQIAQAMREMRKMSNDVQRALDLHEYDGRYEGGSSYGAPYNGGASSSWTSGEYGESGGEAPANTRPWSPADTEDGPSAVMTVEPPGPPILREGRQSSETKTNVA